MMKCPRVSNYFAPSGDEESVVSASKLASSLVTPLRISRHLEQSGLP